MGADILLYLTFITMKIPISAERKKNEQHLYYLGYSAGL
jgi:hypothetical protein